MRSFLIIALSLSSTVLGLEKRIDCGNQTVTSVNGRNYCCPGVASDVGSGPNGSGAYCCVGGSIEFSSCFPLCPNSADNSPTTRPCAASIFFTRSDYSQAVSSVVATMKTLPPAVKTPPTGAAQSAQISVSTSGSSIVVSTPNSASPGTSTSRGAAVAVMSNAAVMTNAPAVGALVAVGGVMLVV